MFCGVLNSRPLRLLLLDIWNLQSKHIGPSATWFSCWLAHTDPFCAIYHSCKEPFLQKVVLKRCQCLHIRHPPWFVFAAGAELQALLGGSRFKRRNHQGSPQRSCWGIWVQMSEHPAESWPQIGFVLGWEQGHCFSLEVYLLFRLM